MSVARSLVAFRASGATLANRDRDFAEWHLGRPFYYCWAAMVEEPSWIDATRRAARLLSPWLVPGYERQPHVTILPAGFPADPIRRETLSDIARRVRPFVIALGHLGSFTSSPCFEVSDESGGLLALRRGLVSVLRDPLSQVDDANYQPHLTVGLYRDRFDTREILRRIGEFEPTVSRPVVVRDIALCAYRTCSIKGPLIPVATVALESGTLSVLDHQDLFQ